MDLGTSFARALVRARFYVIIGWLGVTMAAVTLLPEPQTAGGAGLRGLVPARSEAIDAEIDSIRAFGFPLLSRTAVVQRNPEGLSPLAQARVLLRAVNLTRGLYPELQDVAGALPVVNTLELFPSSSERGTTAVTYLFFEPDYRIGSREVLAERFIQRHLHPGRDAPVGVTGSVPGRLAQGRLIKEHLGDVERLTVLVIALIVGFHFRSVGAPLVTLSAAGISFVLAFRTIGWVSRNAGLTIPEELEPLVVVLLLGIVTDYSIFFLEHARGVLRAGGATGREAARRSTGGTVGIVVTAGLAVALGTASLLLARLDTFRALGPGMAVAVLAGLSVSITFVPAMVAVLGELLFWPSLTRAGSLEGIIIRFRAWRRRMTERATRPAPATAIAAAGIALLLVLSLGLGSLRLGFSIVGALPEDSPSHRAAVEAGKGFAPGIISPTMLVLRTTRPPAELGRLVDLQQRLEGIAGIAGVIGPREVGELAELVERLPATQAGTVGDVPGEVAQRVLRTMVTEDARALRMVLVLEDPPLSASAIETVRRVERVLPELLRRSSLRADEASLAGDTALAAETIDGTLLDLRRIGVAVTVLMILLLAAFLRALVAPLYLVAVSVLAFLASLGLMAFVFAEVLGVRSTSFLVPFASAVLLVSLGSDYNVFLVGRIWVEARERPLRTAIATATPAASRAIAVAGVTLAASFAVLGTVPLRPMQQLAFVMAAGILLDTFLVRSFIVPALIAAVGRRSGWPGPVGRAGPAQSPRGWVRMWKAFRRSRAG